MPVAAPRRGDDDGRVVVALQGHSALLPLVGAMMTSLQVDEHGQRPWLLLPLVGAMMT